MAVAPAAAQQKPNIVAIMGDDIGIWNIGAYHRGMMAGRRRTSTRSPLKACCSPTTMPRRAARRAANFITGELPIRTGMTTVGQAGATSACRQRR